MKKRVLLAFLVAFMIAAAAFASSATKPSGWKWGHPTQKAADVSVTADPDGWTWGGGEAAPDGWTWGDGE